MTKEMESEVQYMCNLSDWVENKGIEKGRTEGNLSATIRYYRKGYLTLNQAASELGLTVDEFTNKMNSFQSASM